MQDYQGTYLAWGPPGTGKTTFLTNQIAKIVAKSGPCTNPVMVCSLTRSAASEVAGRKTPLRRDAIGTLHSMAYRTIGSPDVAEAHLDDWNTFKAQWRMSVAAKADVDEAGWDQRPGQAPGDDLLADLNLLRARMTPRKAWPTRIKGFESNWTEWKNLNHLVDFSDMIDIALRDYPNQPPGRPGVIIADEAQDHSAMEYALLRAWGNASDALIMTGDPWQALYCWRGAHPDLFLDPSVPDDHKMTLSQSWRIPRAVHATAMKWVRGLSDWTDISYKPRPAEGSVVRSRATWKNPEPAVRDAIGLLEQGKSVMFQTSCSYMLSPIVATLRKYGVPFSNPWRTKQGAWNPLRRSGRGVSMAERLLDFLRPDCETYGQDARRWTYQELDNWASILRVSRTIKRKAKAGIRDAAAVWPHDLVTNAALDDWFETESLGPLMRAFESRDPELFDPERKKILIGSIIRWWTDRLLKARIGSIGYLSKILTSRGPGALVQSPQCYVGTIHSFKGGQADSTFLFPDLSPSGWSEWNQPGPHRDGVIRLIYVGMTRAKESLVLCDPATSSAVDLR